MSFFCAYEIESIVALGLEELDQEVVLVILLLSILVFIVCFLDLLHIAFLVLDNTIKVDLFHDLIEIFKVKAIFLLVSDTSRFH